MNEECYTANKGVAQRYICGICLNFFKTPTELPCGHVFCFECILLVENHKCPYCRQVFEEFHKSIYIEREMKQMIRLKCRKKNCLKELTLDEIENHHQACEYKVCCGEEFHKNKTRDHYDNRCNKWKLCYFCNDTYPKMETLYDHLKEHHRDLDNSTVKAITILSDEKEDAVLSIRKLKAEKEILLEESKKITAQINKIQLRSQLVKEKNKELSFQLQNLIMSKPKEINVKKENLYPQPQNKDSGYKFFMNTQESGEAPNFKFSDADVSNFSFGRT